MKRIFCLVFLITALSSFAQVKEPVDTLITNDGKRYAGTTIKMLDKDNVEFMTQDSVSHRVPISFIRELKQTKNTVVLTRPEVKENELPTTGSGYWDNPQIPRMLVRKHNAGIALTVIGSVFLVGGTTIIVASPNNVRTSSSQYQAGVSFSGAAAVGFLMDLAAIPMTIVGIVRLSRSKKQAERILLSKRVN